MKQPSWLVEPCPAWCVREHHEDDHPDDRRHQGRAAEVPVIAGDPTLPEAGAGPLLVVVQLDRRVGSRETWVRIETAESGELRLALRAETAADLARAVLGVAESMG